MQYYPEFVRSVFPARLQGVDDGLLSDMKTLLNNISDLACPAPGFPTEEALDEAATTFEMLVEFGWRALYMLPSHDLEDLPEKWIDVTDKSPLVNMPVSIYRNPDTKMVIHKVELHADTVDGSPAAVYRLNGDSRLAIMLYATTIANFQVPKGGKSEDAQLIGTHAVSAFIDAFPFHVGWPLTTQVFNYFDDEGNLRHEGFLSDIRNQHHDRIEDAVHHLYTPPHTSVYLKDISWVPEEWILKAESVPDAQTPAEIPDGADVPQL